MSDSLVLCYHAISPDWTESLSVTPEALERQLAWLVRHGWRGVTFMELVHNPPRERIVAVTFDDAFASVLELAHPILSSFGFPATVFAPSAFMSGCQRLSWPGIDHWARTPAAAELAGMCWEDLGTLAEDGWEIGSHTHTHPRLTGLDDLRVRSELAGSRQEIASRTGRPCESIAYPYGDVDERVASAAKAAGYRAGAALSSRLTPLGALRWPRVGIFNDDTLARFLLKAARPTRLLRASSLWPGR
jgi:peptidoglycan/xylan/chitin deacetylase (PgdA/CDA1 family)